MMAFTNGVEYIKTRKWKVLVNASSHCIEPIVLLSDDHLFRNCVVGRPEKGATGIQQPKIPLLLIAKQRIQMIFPKQQTGVEQFSGEQLKKQALELIVSLYLERKKDEDITFLKHNFSSTRKFAEAIRSSAVHGLTDADVEINKILYGENQKHPPQKCRSLRRCFVKQMANMHMLLGLILLALCMIYAQCKNNNEMLTQAFVVFVFHVVTAAVRACSTYCRSRQLSKAALSKTKTKLYTVVRNTTHIEIQESEIVVGDIVELGLKERVPVTGIMLSPGEIYVRERDSQESIRLKANLETCCHRIEHMSVLDLKLSYEKQSLASPIVLRGSCLLKGNSYSIMAIAVTEQNLLNSFGFNREDSFSSRTYEEWMVGHVKKWEMWSIYLTLLTMVVLTFCKFTELSYLQKQNQNGLQMCFTILIEIGVLALVLNSSNLQMYLNMVFIKLITNLTVIQNFEQFFIIDRVICNQTNVVDHDHISISQIALCQNQDLITPKQTQTTNMITHELITQVCQVFGFDFSGEDEPIAPKQKNRINKIIHINKKTKKIISTVMNQQSSRNSKGIIRELNKINDQPQPHNQPQRRSSFQEYQRSLRDRKSVTTKQIVGNMNLLKLPHFKTQQPPTTENVNDPIPIAKSVTIPRNILDSLVALTDRSIRTYYFLPYDLETLEKISYVVVNGEIEVFDADYKERMVMLVKKMKVLYGLTSIIVGYNEGSYNNEPLSTLVCILGVVISNTNAVINLLNQLESVGIKSLIFIAQAPVSQSPQKAETSSNNESSRSAEEEQKGIYEEYRLRNWLTSSDSQNIYDMSKIVNELKRLVCRRCWIANCDCRQKIEEVSNIQPFIQVSNKIKIAYKINEDNLRVLQCAFRQLQYEPICINSTEQSAFDIGESIFLCLRFIEGLKRSVILYYGVSIAYFIVPIAFWVKSQKSIKPIQVGAPVAFLLCTFTLVMSYEIKVNSASLGMVKKSPKIMRKEQTLFVYSVCLFLLVGTQLFSFLAQAIPEFPDRYDELMGRYDLEPGQCKYGPNWSVISAIDARKCSTPETGLQFSRLSTIISVYVYFTLWAVMVAFHRNFREVPCVVGYIVALFFYILLIEQAPQVFHSYSEGLTWQHLLIVLISSAVTVLLSFFLSWMLCRLPIIEYFSQETESKIVFKAQNQSHYSYKLKQYSISKSWEFLRGCSSQNMFNGT